MLVLLLMSKCSLFIEVLFLLCSISEKLQELESYKVIYGYLNTLKHFCSQAFWLLCVTHRLSTNCTFPVPMWTFSLQRLSFLSIFLNFYIRGFQDSETGHDLRFLALLKMQKLKRAFLTKEFKFSLANSPNIGRNQISKKPGCGPAWW